MLSEVAGILEPWALELDSKNWLLMPKARSCPGSLIHIFNSHQHLFLLCFFYLSLFSSCSQQGRHFIPMCAQPIETVQHQQNHNRQIQLLLTTLLFFPCRRKFFCVQICYVCLRWNGKTFETWFLTSCNQQSFGTHLMNHFEPPLLQQQSLTCPPKVKVCQSQIKISMCQHSTEGVLQPVARKRRTSEARNVFIFGFEIAFKLCALLDLTGQFVVFIMRC